MPEPWRHGLQVYAYPFPIDNIQQPGPQSPTSNQRRTTSLSINPNLPVTTTFPDDENRQDVPSSDGLFIPNSPTANGIPIRRIRHAEVILVDEVCSYYGRYWLRLRWPGEQGGFAGYIALGSVNSDSDRENDVTCQLIPIDTTMEEVEENQDEIRTEPIINKSKIVRCVTTGLYYPSSSAMELLHMYDDGISSIDGANEEMKVCKPVTTGMGDEVRYTN